MNPTTTHPTYTAHEQLTWTRYLLARILVCHNIDDIHHLANLALEDTTPTKEQS